MSAFPTLADIQSAISGISGVSSGLPSAADIGAIAANAGVPTPILNAVIQKESGGNPLAVGAAGEIGLMQLMPSTAATLGVDPYDPFQNLVGGATFLGQLFQKYGDWTSALSAYNAGSPSSPAGQAYAQSVLAAAYPPNAANLPGNLFPTAAGSAAGTAASGAPTVPGSTTTASPSSLSSALLAAPGGSWFNTLAVIAILLVGAFGVWSLVKE